VRGRLLASGCWPLRSSSRRRSFLELAHDAPQGDRRLVQGGQELVELGSGFGVLVAFPEAATEVGLQHGHADRLHHLVVDDVRQALVERRRRGRRRVAARPAWHVG
jgi:hypothetical protein